jgi:hypothetical protein
MECQLVSQVPQLIMQVVAEEEFTQQDHMAMAALAAD